MNNRKYRLIISLIISAQALFFSLLYSQTASLNGRVVDASTIRPVFNAVVTLLETGSWKITDSAGYFYFDKLSAGRFTISVRHIAFAGIEHRIWVSPYGTDSVTIEMQQAVLKSDEVVVRSTRAFSDIEKTFYPAIVKTAAQLRTTPVPTVSDLLSRDPGIALVRDGVWETAVSIRGMSRSNIVSLIDNTRIETANDIAGALSLVNVNDLERIEVLKSPGSVLYGTGAFGGVLHFVTKQAHFSDRFNVDCSNSISTVNNEVSDHIAVEGSSARYAARFSGSYRKAGDMTTPVGVLENSRYKDFSFNGSLGMKPYNDHVLLLSYQRSQAEDTGIPGSSSFGPAAEVRYLIARRELFSAEYNIPNLSHNIPFFSLRFSRQEIARNVEVVQGDSLRITPHAVHTTNNVQVESRIFLSEKHQLAAGAEAWQRELDSRREKIMSKTNRLVGERPIPCSKYFSSGVYAQYEWDAVPEEFNVTIGARYDLIRVSNDKAYNPEYTVNAGIYKTNTADSTVLWQSGSAHDESWSMSAGMYYQPLSFIDLTFLVSTAFRSPSLEERYQFLDLGKEKIQIGNPDLRPERCTGVNAGVHFHVPGLKIQTDIFHNSLNNLIRAVPGNYKGVPALVNTNISKAKLYGFEILFEKTITSWSMLKGSFTYVRGEDLYLHANLPQIAPPGGRIELAGHSEKIGTIYLSCSGMAAQNNLAEGETLTKGWITADVNCVSPPLRAGSWSFTVRSGMQNIFDTAYRNHLSTLRGIIKEEAGRNYYLAVDIVY